MSLGKYVYTGVRINITLETATWLNVPLHTTCYFKQESWRDVDI